MIYAFYSFKGGVGRSMALANIGEVFHEKGLRTLLVDWDLEAPGLETYFHRDGELARSRAHPGLIEMLMAYKEAFSGFAARQAAAARSSPEQRQEYAHAAGLARELLKHRTDVPQFLIEAEELPVPRTFQDFLRELYRSGSSLGKDFPALMANSPFQRYLQCIRPSDTRENGLFLLSAGARSEDGFGRYATAVQDFNWSEFYAAYEGREYFAWFRDQIRAIADVVLIDTRTGVTEMGGVCTRHIPDAVLSFCAPNFQNIDGISRVVSGLNRPDVKQARGDRHVEVMVVPTRIDDSESDRLAEFSQLFQEKIERDEFVPGPFKELDRPLWHLQIPYTARYNYREEMVIGPSPTPRDPVTQKLIAAYRRIAVHLAALAGEGTRIIDVFASEIATELPQLSQTAPQMAPPVSEAWVERPQEVQALKRALLDRAQSPQTSHVAVWGFAGTGKTSLAARVCRDPEVTRAYPDGVLWVTADRHWTAGSAQQWLREALGVSRRVVEGGLQQVIAVRRYLLVADDVWDLSDVEELFRFGNWCTQLVITRDLALASHFADGVISIGALYSDEASGILKTPEIPLAGADENERAQLIQHLVTWPLGATLLRAALERRLAQGDTVEGAWEALRDAFRRHEIVAFDQLATASRTQSVAQSVGQTVLQLSATADRTQSVAQSLRETVSRLTVPEKALLVRIGKEPAGVGLVDKTSAFLGRRLADFGLVQIEEGSSGARIHPLIRAYLFAQGELDEQLLPQAQARRTSSSTDKLTAANPDVERAKAILGGETADLDEVQDLGERLKNSRYFGYARRLFERAREHPDARRQPEARVLKLVQRHALCTYRDLDLPATRFGDALAILEQGDLKPGRGDVSSETLGLAGAICKYQWKLRGQRRDLERSLHFYERGAAPGIEHDQGYTAINAAFVLDVLAKLEQAEAPDIVNQRTNAATAFRERIAAILPALPAQRSYAWLKSEYWFFATLAEACFGLRRHDEARYWLREGLPLNPPEWQLESTVRQLVDLAAAQGQELSEGSDAYRTLRLLVGDAPAAALRAITTGKIGIALSGGGFRASFFHIGLLARLAELDVLRDVDVLSCVSGGSIIGVHYYLEVRRLLQEKADAEITRDDYIAIVHRLERDFLAGIQKNLRTLLFAGWWANFWSIVCRSYTRTVYLGELFERHLYKRVADRHVGPRRLNETFITPKDGLPDFNPKIDNWRRSAKVPILLLNATTLNTGHNWQFAVSWMGEPPLGTSSPIDHNEILRRMYYWEAPAAYKQVPLGQAAAASACVPMLFDPIELNGLFPDRSVRLVDGGVHDNQGIAGLLEQECTVMLVSDASGQTNTEDRPNAEVLAAALRTNNILMARVREAQLRELDLLRRSEALRGLVFLHLKKDLDVQQVDWTDCPDPSGPVNRPTVLTSYGIPKSIQRRLSGIRTDLDTFSESEAYALMLSGYRMTKGEIQDCVPGWSAASPVPEAWDFLRIEEIMTRAPEREVEHARLLRLLSVGAKRGFKVWRLRPLLGVTLTAIAVAALAVVYVAATILIPIPPWWPAVAVLLILLLGTAAIAVASLLIWLTHRLFRSQKSMTVIVTGLLMVTVGWALARAHLLLFDWLYRRTGKLAHGPRPTPPY
jgi:predicted acylesterase/phospholipase RssA